MSSGILSCKRDLLPTADVEVQSRTDLNDLTVPLKDCASPVLTRQSARCNSISTDFVSSHTCTVPVPVVCTLTSTTPLLAPLAPKYSTTESISSSQPPLPDATTRKPAPITIPLPTLSFEDINRVPTPLSARGDRKGHLFPYSRTPSPRLCAARSHPYSKPRSFSNKSPDIFGRLERAFSASPASASSTSSQFAPSSPNMHNDSVAIGRYPTSPLSSKLPSSTPGLSPHSPRRGNHGRQNSRGMQLNLGRYHPSNFQQVDSPTALGSSATSAMQGPQITYTRAPVPVQVESPRLLREKHREFIEKARQSSKLAASPFAVKPDAPRLDPLGSPHGVVTPLALEDAADYFTVGGAGKLSPVTSPGARSPRTASLVSDEDGKLHKSRKIEA